MQKEQTDEIWFTIIRYFDKVYKVQAPTDNQIILTTNSGKYQRLQIVMFIIQLVYCKQNNIQHRIQKSIETKEKHRSRSTSIRYGEHLYYQEIPIFQLIQLFLSNQIPILCPSSFFVELNNFLILILSSNFAVSVH